MRSFLAGLLGGGALALCLAVGGYFFLRSEGWSEQQPAPALSGAPVAASATPTPAATPAVVDAEHKIKKPKKKEGDPRTVADFFAADGPVPTFIVYFLPEEWEYLKQNPRRYAEGTLWELGHSHAWKGAAIRCKGTAGSFQGPDQRPGITISMNKYKGAEEWHGFGRWSLNNGAQDNSLLNEQISCEIARMAGVPASRCSHALLKWQGRDLGLYLFKESFDKEFLSQFFEDPNGDLYDGGNVSDIRPEMEKDEGDQNRRENVKELIASCQEKDNQKRWDRLSKILDVDAFLSFLAVESIVCHWDGYNFNRNNYRLYFDKPSGKGYFFLHGTDQTFGDTGGAAIRDPGSMVGQAVMSNPAWKTAYRERVERIYQEVLKPVDWPARVVEVGQKAKEALAKANPQWAKEYEGRIEPARQRVAARIAAIGKQLGDIPKPVKWQNGTMKVASEGWRPEGGAAAVDIANKDGKSCLHIRADNETAASWRKNLTLERGKYRLEVRAATGGVVGTKGEVGEGAGVRISGGKRVAPNTVTGDTGWQDLGFEFESSGAEVVLVAEMRASKGEVWFDRESFRVRQVK